MSRPAQPIDVDAFLASLRDRTAHGVTTIALDGGELPVSVQLRESSRLVFTFSGAVDRATKTLPRFATNRLDDYAQASVIGFSDPSLNRSDDLKLAWYAGHEGFELQRVLPELIRGMIDCLDASRVAFLGSSGGGFAALFYSWQIPGSVAVLSNPQTNLEHYYRGHLDRYRAACWPALETDAPLGTVIETDLSSLYSQACENMVIYLQEASDFHHLKWQFAPFVSALHRDYTTRLPVRMANWGERGHAPVPAKIWLPWLNAALSAPVMTGASVEETWASANSDQPTSLSPLPPRPITRADRDEQIAARLARTAIKSLLNPQSPEMELS